MSTKKYTPTKNQKSAYHFYLIRTLLIGRIDMVMACLLDKESDNAGDHAEPVSHIHVFL